jgi:hypothetical protein
MGNSSSEATQPAPPSETYVVPLEFVDQSGATVLVHPDDAEFGYYLEEVLKKECVDEYNSYLAANRAALQRLQSDAIEEALAEEEEDEGYSSQLVEYESSAQSAVRVVSVSSVCCRQHTLFPLPKACCVRSNRHICILLDTGCRV